ncbi:hypothetical protein FA13DRAFT_125924 [Coprinellus micaceus]|uniref:Secreted protein n=1 Tax=Coprinellus micaceus TaxID=71717 RepID=A0A4Y7TIH0_COPMI|nr:hypothetical protein FA13DRAFT_125924 [Coprinellus micaceus]
MRHPFTSTVFLLLFSPPCKHVLPPLFLSLFSLVSSHLVPACLPHDLTSHHFLYIIPPYSPGLIGPVCIYTVNLLLLMRDSCSSSCLAPSRPSSPCLHAFCRPQSNTNLLGLYWV